jgi:hypothetical protein
MQQVDKKVWTVVFLSVCVSKRQELIVVADFEWVVRAISRLTTTRIGCQTATSIDELYSRRSNSQNPASADLTRVCA